MKSRRKVTIVSTYYPPSTVAGVHRARFLMKHLSSFDWIPRLVCVSPKFHIQILDPELADISVRGSDSVEVGAFSYRTTKYFGIGDLGLRALPFMLSAIRKIVIHDKPDVLFFTGAPFYPLLLAEYVKRSYGVPTVVDMQDPWHSKNGPAGSLVSKQRLSNYCASILEPIALRSTDAITSVSEIQNQQLLRKYPFLSGRLIEAIPIGGDPDDFRAVNKGSTAHHIASVDGSKFNINYVGTMLPRSLSILRILFLAFRLLAKEEPALVSRVKLNFIGTSNRPENVHLKPVTEIAKQYGVSKFVSETPRRVPFLEALSLLGSADALLMIGSDEPHYTASKIYPNLMANRPYFAIFHELSSSREILQNAGGGIVLDFSSDASLQSLAPEVKKSLRLLISDSGSLGSVDATAYADFTAEAVTGRFSRIFERISHSSRHL